VGTPVRRETTWRRPYRVLPAQQESPRLALGLTLAGQGRHSIAPNVMSTIDPSMCREANLNRRKLDLSDGRIMATSDRARTTAPDAASRARKQRRTPSIHAAVRMSDREGHDVHRNPQQYG
jgi:hypothetical protein